MISRIDTIKQGKYLMQGAIQAMLGWLLLTMIILSILSTAITLCMNAFDIGIDDSDKDGWNRSGLIIYKDHKTGIEYVGNRHGLVKRERK